MGPSTIQTTTPATSRSGVTRRVVVELKLPFAVEHRGRPNREYIVGWDGTRAQAYLAALRREIEANSDEFSDCVVAAMRLDGGIATNAPAEDLWQTCRTLRERFHVEDGAVLSARASICNVSGASMTYLRRAGVTRFDLELLALDSADFVRLNHADAIQDLDYVVDSFLKAYANKSLGIVLSYGFDAPNTSAFRRSIVQFTRMPACHLILEPWKGSCVAQASDELATAQLAEARDVLGNAGYTEYVPLHFAKPGDEDPFWALRRPGTDGIPGCDLLGFGLGATTVFGTAKSINTADWDTYLRFSGDYTKITVEAGPTGDPFRS